MIIIEIDKRLDTSWYEFIENEVTLNLPPLEEHRAYTIRFNRSRSNNLVASAYSCETKIAEHGCDIAIVKVSTQDGKFAVRQCLQRAKRDLRRRSLFNGNKSGINQASSREWTFA